jgi:hypothetical protein
MRNSLDVNDYEDSADMVADIEQVFAIKFADAELEACRTAGDLNDVLWRHMSQRADAGNIRCMNAMAFNALRRVLVAAGGPRNAGLSTRLDGFGMTPKQLSLAVREQTGLVLDFAYGVLGNVAGIAALAGFVCGLLGLVWHSLFIAAVVLILCSWVLMKLDNRSYKGCETAADAVAKMATANFGAFVEKGARFDAQAVWQALRETLSLFDGTLPARSARTRY